MSRIICEGTDASNHNEKSIETGVVGTEGKAEHTKDGNTVVADIESSSYNSAYLQGIE